MIGRLKGIILEKQPPQILLENNGIGYEINMPTSCFSILPENGQEIVIYTHFVFREDTKLIFGFTHKQEQIVFRELIKINGIGPKLALAILSGMSAQQFIHAMIHRQIDALVQLPGVGKKTAERLLIEMKDRLKEFPSDLLVSDSTGILPTTVTTNLLLAPPESQAVSALVTLGYKSQEASYMVNKVMRSGADCESLIKDALRTLL